MTPSPPQWVDVPNPGVTITPPGQKLAGTAAPPQWVDIPYQEGDAHGVGAHILKGLTLDSPFNPANWGKMVESAFESPFSDEHMAEAEQLATPHQVPKITRDDVKDWAGDAVADVTNGALMGMLGAAAVRGSKWGAAKAAEGLEADPSRDLMKVYKPKDPRFKERIGSAVADIKQAAGKDITSNEHLTLASPDELITPALRQNRTAWDRFFAPAEERGVTRHGQSIVDATEASLKGTLTDEQRSTLLNEAKQRYGRNIGVRELQEMLQEKNGELQPFYSRSEAVRGAAEQGGALTGRSQALLKAQKDAIANTLYEALDPENKGAGPREIQRRYGAVKMLANEAEEARNDIEAEKAGTPAGKVAKTGLATLDLLTAPLREGGLTEGFLKIPQQYRGSADPLIARAFRNAPEFEPHPEPAPSGRAKVLQTGRAPLGLPPARAVIDQSLGSSHGDLLRPGTMTREELARMGRVDQLQEGNIRGTPHEEQVIDHDIPERVARVTEARQRLSTALAQKPYGALTNPERVRIDDLINEGYGFAAQPGEPEIVPPVRPAFEPRKNPAPPAAKPLPPPPPAPIPKATYEKILTLRDLMGSKRWTK